MSRLRSMMHRRLPVGGGGGGGTGGVAQKSNFIFEGFIRLPWTAGLYGVSKFINGGAHVGIAFNPAGNGGVYVGGGGSLLVSGLETQTGIGGPAFAEITIPQPGATRTGAPTAAFLSQFYSPDEDAIDDGMPRDGGDPWHVACTAGGFAVYNGKFYGTTYINYDSNGAGNAFIYRRPVNLATVGQREGPLGPNNVAGQVAGGLAIIPPEWQSVLGNKKMISSITGVSITSRCSQGPSLNIFDPVDSTWSQGTLASSDPLIYTAVANYPYGTPSQWLAKYDASSHGQINSYPTNDPWVEPEPFWSGGTYMGHGLVVLDTFKTVLAFYTVGLSRWNYGLGINTFITGQEAQGIYPPNPPVEPLPPASWDNTTSGQLASASNTPINGSYRITIPFLTFDNSLPGQTDDLPINSGRNLWLKSRSTPVQNLGSKCAERHGVAYIVGKGNKGLSNAYVDVDVAFGTLSSQAYTIGKPAIYDPNNIGQGNHAPPYRTCAYAYNIDDLAAAWAGTKNNYNVLPYAMWDMAPFIFESGETIGLGNGGWTGMTMGQTIDHVNKRVFFLRPGGDPTYANTAIIAVMKYQ